MKPTVTIIYNVVLAITSVLLLYSYFYVLVYDKDFFTEEHTHNTLNESAKIVDKSNLDSSSVNIRPMPASPIKIDTIVRDTSNATLSKTKINLSVSTDLEKKNSLLKEKETKEKEVEPVNFLDMLVVMFLAGMLGGVLANLRGIFEFYREEKMFPDHLFIPYLIRPLTAAISGLLIFFISHLIISSTANPTYDNEYISFRGMVSFMSLAIISGFASQEFTERLKAAAGTLFGISPSQPLEKARNIPKEADSNTTNPDPSMSTDSNATDRSTEESSQTNIPTSPPTPQSQQKMGKSRYINRD
ncbi:hypothetical protein SAMN04487910_1827 [Aquimarina amphilecti]|uniref:Uncharacterized protein n=1 Tax=Aquimarina amphilecti TaxID=1038014 RepID=A0A1H7MRT9_AQUAM|nr:hypothetical protein [Aquimarina amphilecti]SEL13801.1 hypothetical protein SAMN04487910_1827 [Aquimarina amphilecti]